MVDPTASLTQFIEKLLVYWGKRDVTCRVFPPSPQQRSYSILLEKDRFREQFFLAARRTRQFAKTGNEMYVLSEIRLALHNLDKLARRKPLRH